jgi:transcription elongation factor GreB
MSINKNYITPEGFKLLQEELNNLIKQERPDLVKVISWAAGNGDRSENGDYIYGKKRLRQIDARIKFLLINIEDANIIHFDEKMDQSKIFFGAKVKLFDENEEKEINIRIVGAQEINHHPSYISWHSPLAHALIGKMIGDNVDVDTPNGTKLYSVLEICY